MSTVDDVRVPTDVDLLADYSLKAIDEIQSHVANCFERMRDVIGAGGPDDGFELCLKVKSGPSPHTDCVTASCHWSLKDLTVWEN